MLKKALCCPFCGKAPEILPKNPEREGDAWGEAACVNEQCPAQSRVVDGAECELGSSEAHKNLAIDRWNKRK